MTERDAFVRAILENPADDFPRLVYADWLEEHGEGARAEFIRVQCKLKSFRGGDDMQQAVRFGSPREFYRLQRRERELLSSEGRLVSHRDWWPDFDDTWLFKLAGTATNLDHPRVAHVGRGFVASVKLTTADFLKHAEVLFRNQPITRVVLSDKAPWDMTFAGHSKTPWHWLWLGDEWWPTLGRGYCLPAALWDRLDATPDGRGKSYPTREAALDALSDACVAHGRGLVGLPPLTQSA